MNNDLILPEFCAVQNNVKNFRGEKFLANLAKYQNSQVFFLPIYIAHAATYRYMVHFYSPLVCAKCRYCNTLTL